MTQNFPHLHARVGSLSAIPGSKNSLMWLLRNIKNPEIECYRNMSGFSSLGPSQRFIVGKSTSFSVLNHYTLILGRNKWSVYMIKRKSVKRKNAEHKLQFPLLIYIYICLYMIQAFMHAVIWVHIWYLYLHSEIQYNMITWPNWSSSFKNHLLPIPKLPCGSNQRPKCPEKQVLWAR